MADKSTALLDRLARAQADRRWDVFDTVLGELARSFEPALVGPLLATIVDDILGEEHVFGLVHLAESADARDYVHGFLAAIPDLSRNAPEWARTLLARILNSEIHFRLVKEDVDDLSPDRREVLGHVASAVQSWDPARFGPRCEELRLLLE